MRSGIEDVVPSSGSSRCRSSAGSAICRAVHGKRRSPVRSSRTRSDAAASPCTRISESRRANRRRPPELIPCGRERRLLQRQAAHRDVHANVLTSRCLTEDVRALEMAHRVDDFPRLLRTHGGVEFPLHVAPDAGGKSGHDDVVLRGRAVWASLNRRTGCGSKRLAGLDRTMSFRPDPLASRMRPPAIADLQDIAMQHVVPLANGMDEITLAVTADAYSSAGRSCRSESPGFAP